MNTSILESDKLLWSRYVWVWALFCQINIHLLDHQVSVVNDSSFIVVSGSPYSSPLNNNNRPCLVSAPSQVASLNDDIPLKDVHQTHWNNSVKICPNNAH